ncbi:MAG: hypothetical protein QW728_05250, partial [Thermoplasmata archaeon]
MARTAGKKGGKEKKSGVADAGAVAGNKVGGELKVAKRRAFEELEEHEKVSWKQLEGIVSELYNRLEASRIPALSIPVRTKGNIVFDEKYRVWKYGNSRSYRNAKTLDGAFTLLKTTY